MNFKGLLVVVALAAAALLVPTGATPLDPLGTDTVSEDIVVEPAEGPNGDYAMVNEDDEIELLLTGANPYVDGDGLDEDAITPIPRVFTMTNIDDSAGKIWLTDDADDVRFYRGDDAGDSMEGRENAVVLGPSDSVAVGLLVDTRGDHDVESAETFTIHAEPADDDDSDDRDSDDDDDAHTDGPEPTATPDGDDAGVTSGSGGGLAETRTTESDRDTTDSNSGGLPELGGIGLGALLWLLLALLAAVVALAIARRYRD